MVILSCVYFEDGITLLQKLFAAWFHFLFQACVLIFTKRQRASGTDHPSARPLKSKVVYLLLKA